jgi:two-component system, cell cycle sensor histidine kinase and response regulator CckA
MNMNHFPSFAMAVNNDPVQRQLLSGLLRNAGIEPCAFTNAESALLHLTAISTGDDGAETSDAHLPALIVTALSLPVIDGPLFCRQLRSAKYQKLHNIPIVITSAAAAEKAPEKIAADLGVVACLSSPVNEEYFIKLCLRACRATAPFPIRPLLENEKALARSQAELKAVFEHAPVMMCVVDKNRDIRFANAAFAEFTELSMEDLTGRRACGIFGCINALEDPRGCGFGGQCQNCLARIAIEDTLQTGTVHKNIEFHLPRLHNRRRSEFYLLISTALIETDTHTLLLLCLNDITDRKKAEKDLQKREQYFGRLFENAGDAIFIEDEEDRIIDVNACACDLLGYSREELLKMYVPQLQAPEHRGRQGTVIKKELDRRSGIPFETIDVRKDGTLVPVEVTTVSLDMVQNSGVLSIVRDISARKQAEADRNRLIQAIEQSGETIAITDPQGVILYANPTFAKVTGYSVEEAICRKINILKSRRHDDLFYQELRRTISSGTTFKGLITNKKKDGTRYTEEATNSPLFGPDGTIVNYIAVKLDITEKIQADREKELLEKQYMQAQKMESAGRLAGGIAHDFNNMLSVILGHVEIALSQVDAQQPLLVGLEQIREAAQRSAELTRQLLTYARKQSIIPQILDINAAVQSMLSMLRRMIGEDIHLQWLPRDDVYQIEIDPSQLDQILANLCVNARDAIADVGILTISTATCIICEESCANKRECKAGAYAMLSVTDTGTGMDKETVGKIFEPFFTTKGVGVGTGLGLATVYGAVKQNGGFINVTSEPGIGTTFKICLPRAKGYIIQAPRRTLSAPAAAAKGQETILMAEDDPAVQNLFMDMLERGGYTVLSASLPSQAIALVEKNERPIHLLLTDVIIPEMNGPDLAKTLAAIRPTMKCLFMSGYPADIIAHRGVINEHVHFIQKPLTKADLARKIREVLELHN